MEPRVIQLKGYVNPRTGSYVRTREDADPEEVAQAIAFDTAWRFFWNGPIGQYVDGQAPVYSRQQWLASEARQAWLEALSKEQRAMLADTSPPEEVLHLESKP
jgi:hypothetical protein